MNASPLNFAIKLFGHVHKSTSFIIHA